MRPDHSADLLGVVAQGSDTAEKERGTMKCVDFDASCEDHHCSTDIAEQALHDTELEDHNARQLLRYDATSGSTVEECCQVNGVIDDCNNNITNDTNGKSWVSGEEATDVDGINGHPSLKSPTNNGSVNATSSDAAGSKEMNAPSPSTLWQAKDIEGCDKDLVFGGFVMEDMDSIVSLHADYIIYQNRYYPAPMLIVSDMHVRIEGLAVNQDAEPSVSEWGIEDIYCIESQWCNRVNVVRGRLCFLAKGLVQNEIMQNAAGIEEIKFAIYDPQWVYRLEKIMSLNRRYQAAWKVLPPVDDFDVEDALPIDKSEFFSRPYFPNFEEHFEEVVYPEGDIDAVSICKRDVDLLQPETFINDTIIDFYIKFLKIKIEPEEKNRFHFFNSFFFRKLADLDKNPESAFDGKAAFQRVRKWTRKLSLFEKDYIFIPVNYRLHWSLIVICHPGEVAGSIDGEHNGSSKVPCILHMDSIRGSHSGLKGLIQSYLCEEWKERHKDTPEDTALKFLNLRFLSLEAAALHLRNILSASHNLHSLPLHFCGVSSIKNMATDALKNHLLSTEANTAIRENIRTYQVVVAATREMGIGVDGKLPWRLPSDLKFFKDVTLTTSGQGKKNAVIMGRKTWDSIPVKHRPLPGRLNVILSRDSEIESFDDVVKCGSMEAALKMLAGSPYGFSVEKVFVIGGGQILREALNAPACEAIHLTEIQTNIECDTFIPAINKSVFHPWYSSFPYVENGIRYAFTTFVRVRRDVVKNSVELEPQNVSFLPEIVFKRHEAFTYFQLIQGIVSNGDQTEEIISKFGYPMRYNLRKTFPLFTSKGVLWHEIVEELLWMINGLTNSKVMDDKDTHILNKYASRSYLDSIGLQDREEGDLGPFYGFQWRHFGARYTNMHANYTGQGTDQLAEVINKIKNNPEDRRIILSSWNPSDIKATGVPPQHMFAQFYVANGELSCLVYHRSANLHSDLPVCIASYALLTCMLAHVCDVVPGDLIHVIGDIDLQSTNIGLLHEQLDNSPNLFPILRINPEKKNIESFVPTDFELIGCNKFPSMKLDMNQFISPAKRPERHGECMYLELIQDIISTGNVKGDRTGTGTVSKFGCQMRFDLRESFPLLTTKRVFWRGIVEELLWFISGSTNAKVLQEKNIHIWDGNASRSYLDSIGLKDREEGDLGPVYGFQWRHFGARYTNMHANYSDQGIDQLAEIINKIKNRPDDKDIVLTAWNPPCLKEMALPPCHMLAHFLVANGEVSCLMYQRSADMGLGVPFNIASYSLLTCMIAHVCDLVPGDFVHVIGDTHIYNTHLEPLREQLKNSPKPFPVLKINPEKKKIDSFVADDFELIGYEPHRKIGMKMAV